MLQSESVIEKKVCDYAKSKKWLVYKFLSPSNKGVPDRIFLKRGFVIFIEFKSKGKMPTKLQRKVINEILKQYFSVYVVDDFEKGKNLIDVYDEKIRTT